MRRGREILSTTEIVFVVKNSLQTHISPPKVPSPEETEDVGLTTIREYPQ
jgi:hypothetical protein